MESAVLDTSGFNFLFSLLVKMESSKGNLSDFLSKNQCEWAFKDEKNCWIKYGEPNTVMKMNCVTTVSSDDIESYYLKDSNGVMNIESKQHKYILDFVKMTQRNKETGVERPICRRAMDKSGTSTNISSANPCSIPLYWTPMPYSNDLYRTTLLGSSDTEYIEHVNVITETLPRCIIMQMYRVQNLYLWKAYVNKKEYLSHRFPNVQFTERYLFHGTDPKNVQSICEENVDWRLHGTRIGQAYGRGAYFSSSALTSSSYAVAQGAAGLAAAPPKVMFIVKVLVGRTALGNTTVIKPPKDGPGGPYDTSVNNVASPTVFVKYDSQEYYPEYYFEFN